MDTSCFGSSQHAFPASSCLTSSSEQDTHSGICTWHLVFVSRILLAVMLRELPFPSSGFLTVSAERCSLLPAPPSAPSGKLPPFSISVSPAHKLALPACDTPVHELSMGVQGSEKRMKEHKNKRVILSFGWEGSSVGKVMSTRI